MTLVRLHILGVGVVDFLAYAGDAAQVVQRFRDAGYRVTITL